jgi:hypothetical protein
MEGTNTMSTQGKWRTARRAWLATLAATSLASTAVVGIATTSGAAVPAQCTGAVLTSTLTGGTSVQSIPAVDGNSVRVRTGYRGGKQYGYAIMDGSTLFGEGVKIRVTKDGGKTEAICNSMPVKEGADGQPVKTVNAYPTSPSSLVRFKACGDILVYKRQIDDRVLETHCTAWW